MYNAYAHKKETGVVFKKLMTLLQDAKLTFLDMSNSRLDELTIKQQRALRYEISKHDKLRGIFTVEKVNGGLSAVEELFQSELTRKAELDFLALREPMPSAPVSPLYDLFAIDLKDPEIRKFASFQLRG